MDLINIRRVAWDQEAAPAVKPENKDDLIEIVTAKILERLNKGE